MIRLRNLNPVMSPDDFALRRFSQLLRTLFTIHVMMKRIPKPTAAQINVHTVPLKSAKPYSTLKQQIILTNMSVSHVVSEMGFIYVALANWHPFVFARFGGHWASQI